MKIKHILKQLFEPTQLVFLIFLSFIYNVTFFFVKRIITFKRKHNKSTYYIASDKNEFKIHSLDIDDLIFTYVKNDESYRWWNVNGEPVIVFNKYDVVLDPSITNEQFFSARLLHETNKFIVIEKGRTLPFNIEENLKKGYVL